MTQQLIQAFAAKHNLENRWPELKPGMTVRVHQKLKGEKSKASVFEGIVIARKHGNEPGAAITVRRAVGGYGVEKVFPLRLPSIEKIEVVKVGRTRRAKMYYLRGKSTREIRKKTRAEKVALHILTAEPEPTPEPAPETTKEEAPAVEEQKAE